MNNSGTVGARRGNRRVKLAISLLIFSLLVTTVIIKISADKTIFSKVILATDRSGNLRNILNDIDEDEVHRLAANRKLEFILLDMSDSQPSSKKIAELPYPAGEGDLYFLNVERPFEKLYNFVQGNDLNHFYIINIKFFEGEFLSISKVLYQPATQNLVINETVIRNEEWNLCNNSGVPFAFDSADRMLFSQFSCRTIEGEESRRVDWERLTGGFGMIGGGLIDDTRVALFSGNEDGGWSNLSIFSIREDSTGKIAPPDRITKFEFGKTVVYWHNEIDTFNPIAVSPLKNRLVFFANLPDNAEQRLTQSDGSPYSLFGSENKLDQFDLYLVSFNLNENYLEKLIKIKDRGCFLYFPQVAWCPDSKRNLVAASYELDVYDENYLESKTFLIDVDKKKALKEWTFKNKLMRTEEESKVYCKSDTIPVKSIRWSPDGRKVGFLTVDGQLFIYDIEKDSTTCVAEDREYFDFYWVE